MNDQNLIFSFWHTKCKNEFDHWETESSSSISSPLNQNTYLIVRCWDSNGTKITVTTSPFSSNR